MPKKIPYDESLFTDAVDIAVDVLDEYLRGSDYGDEQIETITDKLKVRLDDFLQDFMDDMPDPLYDEDQDDEDA